MKQLTNNEILKYAPSAGATAPFSEVSNKYSFLPTIRIVDMLREKGWFPTRAEQVRVRKKEREGVQKHLIRFQHPDLQLGEEAIEAVLVNSHDRSCAYNLFTGVFRLICSNGMITGDTFERISVRHINFNPKEIVYASLELIDNAPIIAGSINEMKAIDLEPNEKVKVYDKRVETPPHYDTFAEFQHAYHYGDIYSPYIKQDEPLKIECQHFLDCIESGATPLTGAAESLRVVQVLEAASQSLKKGGNKVEIEKKF